MWNQQTTWEQAEEVWAEGAKKAAAERPLKTLSSLPKMPGMTPDTARFLKWKALHYIIKHDKTHVIRRYLLKFRYLFRLLGSYFRPSSFFRQGDFFLYGVRDFAEFEKKLTCPDTLVVVGFSYCHKPFECPSGRFSAACIHDASHPVCRQCSIGQMMHALPDSERILPLCITTIHHIGEEMCKIRAEHPNKKITFLITACEMTLTMFADFGNMIGIQGVGVRLDGRICNTMQAFHLSENGIKPGLTVVLPDTQKQILRWIRLLHI